MPRYARCLIYAVLLLCAATTWAQSSSSPANEWTGTDSQKIWGLMTVYSEVKYTFPHFDSRPDLDWDTTVQEYIPRVIGADDMGAYYQVLDELVALLDDGHTAIEAPWGDLKPGYDTVPLEVRILNDHFYVDRIGGGAELADQGVEPGAEILSVEGIPVAEHFADYVLRYHTSNTKQSNEALGTVYMFYGPAEKTVTMKLQDLDGKIHDVTLTRDALNGASPFLTRRLENYFLAKTIKTRMLPGGIQYVDIPTFQKEQVGTDFIDLIDSLDESVVKGMIIDLRYNTGGSNAVSEPMAACLIDQTVSSPIMKYRTFCGACDAWGHEPTWDTVYNEIAPRVGKRFQGPLVVLTGGLSASASEDFIIEVTAGDRATLIGQTTAGSSGHGLKSSLPGGGTLFVSTFTASVPGGDDFVGVGIAPHMVVEPTREDLAAGRDPVLEYAVEFLQGKTETDNRR